MEKQQVKHNIFCIILFGVFLPNLCLGILIILFWPISVKEIFSIELIVSIGLYLWLLYWNIKLLRGGVVICELTYDGFNYAYLDSKLRRLYQFVLWEDVVSAEKVKGVSFPSFIEVKVNRGRKLPKPVHGWRRHSASISKLTFMAPVSLSYIFSWTELFNKYRSTRDGSYSDSKRAIKGLI